MIKSFKHKGLKKFGKTGSPASIKADHIKRLKKIIARLKISTEPQDMDYSGYELHKLNNYKGRKDFWAVSVSGNWRVIFRFDTDKNVCDVDYRDYHH